MWKKWKSFIICCILTMEMANPVNSVTIRIHEPCSTLIYARNSLSQFEDAAAKSIPEIKMENIPIIYYNFLPQYLFRNSSYLDYEWTEQDLNSIKFNIKYKRQCNTGLISIPNQNSTTSTIQLVNELLFIRVLRPSHDYFIFIGNDSAFLEGFLFNKQFSLIQDLKYKYGFLQSSNTKFSNSLSLLVNPCRHSQLFSRQCSPTLNGKRFHVTTVFGLQWQRHQEPTPDGTNENTKGEGIYYEILKASSEHFNFTFKLTTSGFNGASGFKKNGSWYGTIGEVFKREVDFGIGAAITRSRLPIVDPIASTSWIKHMFFIRRPEASTKWTAIFKPLDALIWVIIFLVTFISVPLYHWSTNDDASKKSRKHKILIQYTKTLAVFYRLILEQSWNEHGHETGLRKRYIIMLWSFFCLVLTTSYRSKLMNFLTFLTSGPVPSTHDQLVDEGYILYFRYYGGAAFEYYRTSKLPIHQHILGRVVFKNTSYDCMLSTALTPNSACLDYDVSGNYAMLTNATLYAHRSDGSANQELFIRSTSFFIPLPMAWVFRKGSPLAQSFNEFTLKILAHGFYEYWISTDWMKSKIDGSKWLRTQNNSEIKTSLEESFKNSFSSTKPLNVSSLIGLGYILIIGLSISFVFWLAEILLCKFCVKRLN